MEIDWDEIQQIWQTGIGSLNEKAKEYGVSLPDIMLKARVEGWGSRASEADLGGSVCDMSYDETVKSYRASMLKIKKMSDGVLEALAFEPDTEVKLRALDNISRIFSRILPASIDITELGGVNGDDDSIKRVIREQQLKALRKGDVKMLMFLGKQYLGQKDEMSLFMKDIAPTLPPREAAQLYQEMVKEGLMGGDE